MRTQLSKKNMACASSIGKPYKPHTRKSATAARASVRSARLPSTGKPPLVSAASDAASDSESDAEVEVMQTPPPQYEELKTVMPSVRRLDPNQQRLLARREIEAAVAANGGTHWSKLLEQRANAHTPFPHLTFNDTAEDYSFGLTFSVAGKWSDIVAKYRDEDSSDDCLRLHIPFNNQADMGLAKGVFVPRRIAMTRSYVHKAPFAVFVRLRADTASGNRQTWMDGINRLANNPAGPDNVGLLMGNGFSDNERCLFDWDQHHINTEAFQHWATLDLANMIHDIPVCSDDPCLAAYPHVPTAHVLGRPLHYLAARHCGDLYADATELAALSRVRSILPRASGSEFRVPISALRRHVTQLASKVDRDAHVMSPNLAFLELLVPDYSARNEARADTMTGTARFKSDPFVECTFQFRVDGQVATHTELASVVDELLASDDAAGVEEEGDDYADDE